MVSMVSTAPQNVTVLIIRNVTTRMASVTTGSVRGDTLGYRYVGKVSVRD